MRGGTRLKPSIAVLSGATESAPLNNMEYLNQW